VKVRIYLQRAAIGVTVPVLTYMALSLFAPIRHEHVILLAGSAWCGAVWACYLLGHLVHRLPRFHRGSPT